MLTRQTRCGRCRLAFVKLWEHRREDRLEREKADAEALAVVRELDDWAKANRRFAPAPDWDGKSWGVHVPWPGDTAGSDRVEAATPDAARAAAAAWVRAQAHKAGT